MPLMTPLDEIVLFSPHPVAGNQAAPLGQVGLRPVMLSEAVLRGLESLATGGRPTLVIRGFTYTDPDIFTALRGREDFRT